ncbi:MAG: hypothetical protein Q7U53_17510 [Anaerolineaceae bacterium]|nr:hypothetical protein [Anaerolineaceae bacterium]
MEELVLKVGSTQVHLSGVGIVAPVKGCRRSLPKGSGQTCIEKIEVILHGMPEVVDDWLKMMEALFSRVNLGEQAILSLTPVANLQEYESKVISGRLELLGKGTMDLKRGGMGVSLELIRENFWEGIGDWVPLSNIHGTNIINGLRIDNEYSENDTCFNYATINGEDIDGEVPAPATVIIKHEDLTNTAPFGNILVSNEIISTMLPGDTFIDGSQGSSLLNWGAVMNADASNGIYGLVQWDVTIPLKIVQFNIDNAIAGRIAGRLVRPVLRMKDFVTTNDYWIRCKVSQGDAVEYSRWQKIEVNKKMVILPAMHIPPRDLKSTELVDVLFAFEAQRNVSGSHVLTIDDIDFLPLDGYRHYYNLGDYGLAWNETLYDEIMNDLIYSIPGGYEKRILSHQATGKGIWLMPGKDQCIRVKWDTSSGNCITKQQMKLMLRYRPRRINI